MKKIIFILFVIAAGLTYFATTNGEAEGDWIVDAEYNGHKMSEIPVKQWRILGKRLIPTEGFAEDIAKIGFDNWPKGPLTIRFDNKDVIISAGKEQLIFAKEYFDYGIMKIEGYHLKLGMLKITLMRDKK